VREKSTIDRLWTLSGGLVNTAAASPWRARRDSFPIGPCSALNQALMELGAMICTPKSPRCADCPAQRHCTARALGRIDAIPNSAPRAAVTHRRFAACVIQRNGAVLVRQRAAGVVNAHLWEFPNTEVPAESDETSWTRALEEELGCKPTALTPILTLRHSITRYRITLHAFAAKLDGTQPRRIAGRWMPWHELDRLAFTSAHRRVLAAARAQEAEGQDLRRERRVG
jgi:A/G-specific adenine glycosylase